MIDALQPSDIFTEQDHNFMRLALEEAKRAAERDEVPVGAILVHSETGEILAQNGNRTRELADPTAHAEILVIRSGCEIKTKQRVPEYNLYVTLEPCTMCAAAVSFARIKKIIIGADDPKGGGILHGAKFYEQPTCHHKPEILHGLMANESAEMLKSFFRSKRVKPNPEA